MSTGMAISGYGYNDPYFLAAYNSYNPNFQGAAQSQSVAAAGQGADLSQNYVKRAPEQESSSNAGLILGAAATVASAAALIMAYRKGQGANALEKTVDGLKVMWNGLKGKINSFKPQKLTVTEEGGKTLVKIPGRTNIMRQGVAADGLEAIGKDAKVAMTKTVDGKTVLNDGISLRNFTYNYDGRVKLKGVRAKKDKNLEIQVVKGKISKILADGKAIDKEDFISKNKDIYEELTKLTAQYKRGENLDKLSNIQFAHKADGISRLFTAESSAAEPTLVAAAANRFPQKSKAVDAYLNDHPEYEQLLKDFSEEGRKGWKAIREGYKTDVGTFEIVNGNVTGLRVNEKTFYPVGSEDYKALRRGNKDLFDKIFENKDKFVATEWQKA